MNNLQKCLSDNMKKFRRMRSLSQEKLAERAGASANYIALIESGKNFPSLPMLTRIAAALQVDELDLFCRSGTGRAGLAALRKSLSEEIQQAIDRNFEGFE